MLERLDDSTIRAIDRPHPRLLLYYVVRAMLVPFWLVVLPYHYFRYSTMRYRFDAEGVMMSWGVLFRREITLTYARIQDIHLTSNFVQRWFGLANVEIQTASASSGAEMTIEGCLEYEAIRDYLYGKMRGSRERLGRCQLENMTTRGTCQPVRHPRERRAWILEQPPPHEGEGGRIGREVRRRKRKTARPTL